MELEPGRRIVGDRYVVEGRLGGGGMAEVYRVRHTELGTLFALKVIRTLTPAVRERLVREGRAMGVLRHPNVVPVVDAVELDGVPALLMEYVHGPSLEVDTLFARIDEAGNEAEAVDLHHRLHALLADDLPYLFLWEPRSTSAWREEITPVSRRTPISRRWNAGAGARTATRETLDARNRNHPSFSGSGTCGVE